MFKTIFHVKGVFNTLPLMTHLRECSVVKYPERLHIKIPLYEVLIDKKPVIIINDKYVELIFKDKLE